MNPDFTRYQKLPSIDAESLVGTRSTRVPEFRGRDGDAGGTRPYRMQIDIHPVAEVAARQMQAAQKCNSSRA